MCAHFWLGREGENETLTRIVETLRGESAPEELKTAGFTSPGDLLPVLAGQEDRGPVPFAMRWGFTRPDGKRVFNTRSETCASLPLFRDSLRSLRCAVPALCYYEWEHTPSGARRYAVSPVGCGLFYLAGIWRTEGARAVFSVLTQPASEALARIHPRMPVLLREEAASAWIRPAQAADTLLADTLQAQETFTLSAVPSDDRPRQLSFDL